MTRKAIIRSMSEPCWKVLRWIPRGLGLSRKHMTPVLKSKVLMKHWRE